jgi:hypothetical protein
MQLLDDACLVRILTFLTPLPGDGLPCSDAGISCLISVPFSVLTELFSHAFTDRFNAARVCKRWQKLACDKRMWLRVEPALKPAPNQFTTLQEAVTSAR